MINLTKLSAILVISALAGCTGGTNKIDGQTAALSEVRQAAKSNRTGKKSPQNDPIITRALLDTISAPSLAVTVENTGLTAYLIPTAVRRDSIPGGVTVWKTVQDEQVIVRSGVLIGTRGLGRDLTSANAAPVVESLSARKAGGGLRTLHVRNDAGETDELRMRCELSVVGPKVITIVERAYNTLHLNENCLLESGKVSNDYWIEPDGSVRQSRQWAGHHLGYLSMKLLIR